MVRLAPVMQTVPAADPVFDAVLLPMVMMRRPSLILFAIGNFVAQIVPAPSPHTLLRQTTGGPAPLLKEADAS
jgi:hypothetical protein